MRYSRISQLALHTWKLEISILLPVWYDVYECGWKNWKIESNVFVSQNYPFAGISEITQHIETFASSVEFE